VHFPLEKKSKAGPDRSTKAAKNPVDWGEEEVRNPFRLWAGTGGGGTEREVKTKVHLCQGVEATALPLRKRRRGKETSPAGNRKKKVKKEKKKFEKKNGIGAGCANQEAGWKGKDCRSSKT